MKELRITLEDWQYDLLTEAKGDRTWVETMMDEIPDSTDSEDEFEWD